MATYKDKQKNRALRAKKGLWRDEFKEEKSKKQPRQKTKPLYESKNYITLHAIQRFAERVWGFDVEETKILSKREINTISKILESNVPKQPTTDMRLIVPLSDYTGYKAVIEDRHVITILED